LAGFLDQTLELLDAFDRRVVHGHDDVARAHTGAFGRAGHILDHDAVLDLVVALLLVTERPDGDAELALGDRFLVGRRDHVLLVERADGCGQLLARSIAPDLQRYLRSGFDRRDHGRQITRARDLLAVEFEDHVARLEAGLGPGAAFLDRRHQRAARLLQAEVLRERLVHFLNRDAEPAVAHFAVLLDLVLRLYCDVDRHGEREALEAAAATEDLRVDANHFALKVEQRPSGVARIDRSIRLDEGHVGISRQRARLGADDPG